MTIKWDNVYKVPNIALVCSLSGGSMSIAILSRSGLFGFRLWEIPPRELTKTHSVPLLPPLEEQGDGLVTWLPRVTTPFHELQPRCQLLQCQTEPCWAVVLKPVVMSISVMVVPPKKLWETPGKYFGWKVKVYFSRFTVPKGENESRMKSELPLWP